MLINSMDMAHFVARGFLRLDAVVPEDINQAFLGALNPPSADPQEPPVPHLSKLMKLVLSD